MNNQNTRYVSDEFLKGKSSRELDFLNVNLNGDTPVYVDPLLLYRSPIKEINSAHTMIVEFFKRAIVAIKSGREDIARVMCQFPDAENLLGIATTGVGHGPRKELGKKICDELVRNRHIQEHGLGFLNEFQLVINGIAYDLVSDAAVQISKEVFIEYTQRQCRLHNIPMQEVMLRHVFDWDENCWDSKLVLLPANPLKGDSPFLLTPKTVVRRYPEGDYINFYNEVFKEVMYEKEKTELWKALGKEPKVTFSEIAEKYKSKKAVVNYVCENPESLDEYLEKVKPTHEAIWLEQASIAADKNINQIISPEILNVLVNEFKDTPDKARINASRKKITHQFNLVRPAKRMIPQIQALAKMCREKMVLLLGNYSAGRSRLDDIKKVLAQSYDVVLVEDVSTPGWSLAQGVYALAALARFVIIEDTFPGGQLSELEILKPTGIVSLVLREKGKRASYMSVGASSSFSNISEIEYGLSAGGHITPAAISEGIVWAEARISDQNKFWDSSYPWRKA